MFTKDFYPTTEKLAIRMIEPYIKDLPGKTILEPSAGKGDILDVIKDSVSTYSNDIKYLCIEKNSELQSILRDKKYNLIAYDFLTWERSYSINYIFMNPPFENGDEHLLKAWDVMGTGKIVCVLNRETIDNPFSARRKELLHIIKEHGNVEYVGQAFSKDADRKTYVDCVIVRLSKSTKSEFDDMFEEVNKEKDCDITDDIINDNIARRDMIGNLVSRYDTTKQVFAEFLKVRSKLSYYSDGITETYSDVFKCVSEAMKHNNSNSGYMDNFTDELKRSCWNNVFKQTKFANIMTEKVREEFQSFSASQGVMDFTKENIEHLLQTLVMNRGEIMNKCLLEVFDSFTKYDEENRSCVEGWKTNDAWRVNRKVIIPYCIKYMEYSANCYGSDGDKFRISYSKDQFLDDIDKVMGMIIGKKLSEVVTIRDSLNRHFDKLGYVSTGPFDNKVTSAFFDIKFFKKGTMHLYFRHEYVWKEFNLIAAKGKNWIPHDYSGKI